MAALGLNGASANSFLHCSELSRQLPSLSADLYVLSLGVNDTQSAEFTKEGFYKKLGFLRMLTAMAIFQDRNAAIQRGHVSET